MIAIYIFVTVEPQLVREHCVILIGPRQIQLIVTVSLGGEIGSILDHEDGVSGFIHNFPAQL